MVVNTTNIFSEARTQISNLINSNVSDPKTGTTNSRRRWLYREFPDTTSRDFAGYPIIVIYSPELDESPEDLQGCTSNGEQTMAIEVYVEFNDTNARVDEISNSVFSTLRSLTNKHELLKSNIDIININAGPFDSQVEDGKQLSTRRFLLEFESTLEG